MPFSLQESANRAKAAAIRKADEHANHIYQAKLAKKERKTRAMLARHFPGIPASDAYQLWKIATHLTDKIIWQYGHGEKRLMTESEEREGLFYERRLESDPSVSWYVVDKCYLSVLEQMARAYKDRGQAFSLRKLRRWECKQPSRDPQVRITCTAPLPG